MNKLRNHSVNIVILLIALSVIALLSRGGVGNIGTGGPDEATEACRKHLKETITQIEVYAIDYQDKYPEDWKTLIPNYLKQVPRCPGDTQSYYELRRDMNLPEGIHNNFYFYVVTCSSPRHAKAQWFDNINGPGEGPRSRG